MVFNGVKGLARAEEEGRQCKGGKVESEDRVRSTECGEDNKGDWLDRVWSIGEVKKITEYGGTGA